MGVAVLGLGEAGGRYAADLARTGFAVQRVLPDRAMADVAAAGGGP